MTDGKVCWLKLAHSVGDTVKFVLDDGKKHQGKIVKIHVTVTGENAKTDYEVKTAFRGRRNYAIISSKEVL